MKKIFLTLIINSFVIIFVNGQNKVDNHPTNNKCDSLDVLATLNNHNWRLKDSASNNLLIYSIVNTKLSCNLLTNGNNVFQYNAELSYDTSSRSVCVRKDWSIEGISWWEIIDYDYGSGAFTCVYMTPKTNKKGKIIGHIKGDKFILIAEDKVIPVFYKIHLRDDW